MPTRSFALLALALAACSAVGTTPVPESALVRPPSLARTAASVGVVGKPAGEPALEPTSFGAREPFAAATRFATPAPQVGSIDQAPSNFLGAQIQVYPAGVISTLAGEWRANERDVLTVNAGYNATNRGSNGDHQDEQGGGPGAGLGVRRYYGTEHTGWMLGARADVWYLDIDWEDGAGTPSAVSGNSTVWVLQPTVMGGYRWRLGRSRWFLDVSLAFGAELNVKTDGADVGQGTIALLGAGLSYGF